MKLVLIVPEVGGHGGGIRVFYRPLLRHWISSHDCLVVTGMGSVAEADEQPRPLFGGALQVPLGLSRLNRWRGRFSRYGLFPELRDQLAASWALRELALELKPDVVEVCDIGMQFVAWVVEPAVPFVIQMHGSNGQIGLHDPMQGRQLEATLTRVIEGSLLPYAPAIQTSTKLNQSAVERATGASCYQILPPWDSEQGWPSASAGPKGAGASFEPVLRVFGRLQRWKGAETMAMALRIMGSAAPKVEWYGVDMPFGQPDRSTGQHLGHAYPDVFGKYLNWHPQVPLNEVHDLQRTALCNVVPSIWDVLNYSVIEAMASGRPVICSRGAGACELIEDGVSGLLFDSGDALGLADALRRMLAMPEVEKVRMAEVARAVIRTRLEPERNAARRLEAYLATIADWPVRRPTIPDWIKEAVSPETGLAVSSWPVLDRLPLKGVFSYVGKRLVRRLVSIR